MFFYKEDEIVGCGASLKTASQCSSSALQLRLPTYTPAVQDCPRADLDLGKWVMQAIAKVNEQLQNGSFRRVRGGKKVMSDFLPAADFYIAEDYHQQYLEKGGRFSRPQNAAKGATEPIRCYG